MFCFKALFPIVNLVIISCSFQLFPLLFLGTLTLRPPPSTSSDVSAYYAAHPSSLQGLNKTAHIYFVKTVKLMYYSFQYKDMNLLLLPFNLNYLMTQVNESLFNTNTVTFTNILHYLVWNKLWQLYKPL